MPLLSPALDKLLVDAALAVAAATQHLDNIDMRTVPKERRDDIARSKAQLKDVRQLLRRARVGSEAHERRSAEVTASAAGSTEPAAEQ